MEKIKQKTLMELLNIKNRKTAKEWEITKPIITLVKQYFKQHELEEFLEYGKIPHLEYVSEVASVNGHIISEVLHFCESLKNNSDKFIFNAYHLYGLFLEEIQSEYRYPKTWLSFDEFKNNEHEIYLFFRNKFNHYLLNKNIEQSLEILTIIDNNYKRAPSLPHKFYYMKNFMWIFMPSQRRKNLVETNQLVNKLPNYIKKIPSIKSIIKIAGEFGLAGIIDEKFFNKEAFSKLKK